MPKCALKTCRSNSHNKLKNDGVSYFHFPRDLERKFEWECIIAKERGVDSYKARVGSVVCSEHFVPADMYVTKCGFRRLKKVAIPKLKIDIKDSLLDPAMKIEEVCLPSMTFPTIEDTPRELKLRKNLTACQELILKKNKMIRCLQNRNKRLMLKNKKLKSALKQLNEMHHKDTILIEKLLQHVEVT